MQQTIEVTEETVHTHGHDFINAAKDKLHRVAIDLGCECHFSQCWEYDHNERRLRLFIVGHMIPSYKVFIKSAYTEREKHDT